MYRSMINKSGDIPKWANTIRMKKLPWAERQRWVNYYASCVSGCKMDKSSGKSTKKGKKDSTVANICSSRHITELKKGSTKKAGNRRQVVTSTAQRLTSKPRGSEQGTTITKSCYLQHNSTASNKHIFYTFLIIIESHLSQTMFQTLPLRCARRQVTRMQWNKHRAI
jgi:hypothetical protein